MKAILQRVKSVSVHINEELVGEIQHGILVFLALARDDDFNKAKK